jgi:Tfp pilus assembly protein PilV
MRDNNIVAKGQKGFTFNEVLVAINIVVIAVLGYSVGALDVVRRRATSDNFTGAVFLAQDKMERLKAQSNPANENVCPDRGERGISASGASGGIFDRCWTVADSTLGANLKQIEVTVTWRDYADHSIAVSTLVFVAEES